MEKKKKSGCATGYSLTDASAKPTIEIFRREDKTWVVKKKEQKTYYSDRFSKDNIEEIEQVKQTNIW